MLLYRYEKIEQTRIKTLQEEKIWMSLPDEFNDPFEFRYKLETIRAANTIPIENYMAAARALHQGVDKGLYDYIFTDEIFSEIDKWARHYDHSPTPKFLNSIQERIRTAFGISCFSEKFDDPLMWAHYADCHTGFCIEYDYSPKKLNGNYGMLPVTYTTQRPIYYLNEIVFCAEEIAKKLYSTKSAHWSHEKEYRLINYTFNNEENRKGGSFKLPNGLKIKSIISGLKTSSENIKTLKEVANKIDVNFEQITNDEISYYLKKEKADI